MSKTVGEPSKRKSQESFVVLSAYSSDLLCKPACTKQSLNSSKANNLNRAMISYPENTGSTERSWGSGSHGGPSKRGGVRGGVLLLG